MTILLDPGHGSDTPGKRSPDGRFLEYAFNRDIAVRVASKLTTLGLNAEIIVPELTDVPLKERVSRINARCAALGKGNVILLTGRSGISNASVTMPRILQNMQMPFKKPVKDSQTMNYTR